MSTLGYDKPKGQAAKIEEDASLRMVDINSHLICPLCSGYLIDATTITECMHSFCRACLLEYLEEDDERNKCPQCDLEIAENSTQLYRFLKPDQSLQDLVYKIVPTLYREEICRRKHYYTENSNTDVKGKRLDIRGLFDRHLRELSTTIFDPHDLVSFSLECLPPTKPYTRQTTRRSDTTSVSPDAKKPKVPHLVPRYFRCKASVRIVTLKKLLFSKLDLSPCHGIELYYGDELLKDSYALLDLAYIYSWKKKIPMRLFFNVVECDKPPSYANVYVPSMAPLQTRPPVVPTPPAVEKTMESPTVEVVTSPAAPMAAAQITGPLLTETLCVERPANLDPPATTQSAMMPAAESPACNDSEMMPLLQPAETIPVVRSPPPPPIVVVCSPSTYSPAATTGKIPISRNTTCIRNTTEYAPRKGSTTPRTGLYSRKGRGRPKPQTYPSSGMLPPLAPRPAPAAAVPPPPPLLTHNPTLPQPPPLKSVKQSSSPRPDGLSVVASTGLSAPQVPKLARKPPSSATTMVTSSGAHFQNQNLGLVLNNDGRLSLVLLNNAPPTLATPEDAICKITSNSNESADGNTTKPVVSGSSVVRLPASVTTTATVTPPAPVLPVEKKCKTIAHSLDSAKLNGSIAKAIDDVVKRASPPTEDGKDVNGGGVSIAGPTRISPLGSRKRKLLSPTRLASTVVDLSTSQQQSPSISSSVAAVIDGVTGAVEAGLCKASA